MSTTLKILIPQISNILTKEDLKTDCGFIDAFTNDINDPWLDNHIFLMYEYNTSTKKRYNLYKKLISDESLYTHKVYTINKKKYDIYIYRLINTLQNESLKENKFLFTYNEKAKILDFWGNEEKDLYQYLLNNKYDIKYEQKFIPEIDYQQSILDKIKNSKTE